MSVRDPFDFAYPTIDPFDPFSRAAGGNVMAETPIPIQPNRRARRAVAALARAKVRP